MKIAGCNICKEKGVQPERHTVRNLAACYALRPAQVKQVEAVMDRQHGGAPAFVELPEGSEPLTVCWIYSRDWREIGTITPVQAFKL